MKIIKGTPVSPGVAIGKVYLKKDTKDTITLQIDKDREVEKKRYNDARLEAVQQVNKIYRDMLISKDEKEASIFLAHIDMLEDIEFVGSVEKVIDELGCNAEWAVQTIQEQFIEVFESMELEYMKERAMDVKDVSMRVLRLLQGQDQTFSVSEPVILVSTDLTPSDTAQLNPKLILGIINETGGVTSHAAIIARMSNIPFVVYSDITSLVSHGQMIAFDGEEGTIDLEIDETTENIYMKKKDRINSLKIELKKLIGTKSVTQDGFEMKLAGNIGTPKDVEQVFNQDGHSIGLFRTEFLYMDREDFPTEEEQYVAYKATAQSMQGNPVVIRTLDIGGDKELNYLKIPKEENPFLGCRAIRFCLSRAELWKVQLRALLRASAYGNIYIMFPMIVSLNELRKAKQILEEVKAELQREGISYHENIPVGMMMETPAAAVMADVFAKEVDFFSIGTNDLIQYTMAVDRMNGEVAQLYSPYDPAVLRLIQYITDSAHKHNIWTGICGEAAADIRLLPLWVGFGIDELSMSPGSILSTRKHIQELSKQKCEQIAAQVLVLKTADEIEDALTDIWR